MNAVEAFLERRTAIYWVPDAAPLLPHGRLLVVPFVSVKEEKNSIICSIQVVHV